jgi:hypothetical protein
MEHIPLTSPPHLPLRAAMRRAPCLLRAPGVSGSADLLVDLGGEGAAAASRPQAAEGVLLVASPSWGAPEPMFWDCLLDRRYRMLGLFGSCGSTSFQVGPTGPSLSSFSVDNAMPCAALPHR